MVGKLDDVEVIDKARQFVAGVVFKKCSMIYFSSQLHVQKGAILQNAIHPKSEQNVSYHLVGSLL